MHKISKLDLEYLFDLIYVNGYPNVVNGEKPITWKEMSLYCEMLNSGSPNLGRCGIFYSNSPIAMYMLYKQPIYIYIAGYIYKL